MTSRPSSERSPFRANWMGRQRNYVLIPGAGGDAWYWHAVERELGQRGHDAVSVEVPTDDEEAGLAEYADAVFAAIGDRSNLVLVAQSMGAFLVPLVHERRAAESIILVNAMITAPRRNSRGMVGEHGPAGGAAGE